MQEKMLKSSMKTSYKLGSLVGLFLAAAVFTFTALPQSVSAEIRHRHYYRHYDLPTERDYNKPSQFGYGPAPTGQYPSFEELDHFPGSNNG
jgi:hypothetical protein